MNCLKCNVPLENKYRCPHCGHEDPVAKKIIYSSNWHYNQGLAKAKVRDLSGATVSLRQSLKYNKHNTDARNLLGLVYYQMGEIVAALGEWVISLHFQPNNNRASGFMKTIQDDPTGVAMADKVIKRYNQALEYIKENNADLAILELKKVVNLSPNYVKAYQLLGLLYLQRKQYNASRRALMKAVKTDRNNITTLRYLKEVNRLSEKPEKNTENNEGFTPIFDPNPIVIEDNSNKAYQDYNTGYISFINVLIGIIIGAAVIFLLVVPSVTKSNANRYNQSIIEYSAQITDRNKQVQELQTQVNDLQNKLAQYQSTDTNTSEDAGQSQAYLIQAMKDYLQENYQAAGNSVAEINPANLTSEQASVYSLLRSATKGYAIDSLYATAVENYEGGDYVQALTGFTKVLNLDETYTRAIYYVGRCYHQLGDANNAIAYYTQLIETYPESSLVTDAQNYINVLNGVSGIDSSGNDNNDNEEDYDYDEYDYDYDEE